MSAPVMGIAISLLVTEKLGSYASSFKRIKKRIFRIFNPEAFLRNAAQTARGTEN